MDTHSYNKGQSIMGMVIASVVISLIVLGGLYYYFSSQISEIPEIIKKPTQEKIVTLEEDDLSSQSPAASTQLPTPNSQPIDGEFSIPEKTRLLEKDTLVLLVEDSIHGGLLSEFAVYQDDVKRELGLTTIVKTFSSSASVFEVKAYIRQIYNSRQLNGVLLVGDIPTGKFYHPAGYYPKDNLPLYDYIYQDIYDACEYSNEWSAFDYSHTNCESNQIPPFWVSRLSPNSSAKNTLALLKDYFKRNHEYRTQRYSYKQKMLAYTPTVLDISPEYREAQKTELKKGLKEFGVYDEGSFYVVDSEKENSDQIFLSELRKPYQYENFLFNGHGSTTFHQKNIYSSDITDSNIFFGQFISCSVGRFTTKDYIAGKYLFEGKSLIVAAAPVIITGATARTEANLNYALSTGVPFFEAIKIRPAGGSNFFGDLTLKMRYAKKPSTYVSNDPIIAFNTSSLYFTDNQEVELKVKNVGKSTLEVKPYPRYYKFKEEWLPQLGFYSEEYVETNEHGHYLLAPGTEAIWKIIDPSSQGAPSGNYRGEFYILSNDPINPYIGIPFEAVVD